MTAPAVTCPDWCESGSEQYPCTGEHWQPKVYLPATGRRPHEVTFEGGAQYPVIGVGLDYDESDGEPGPSLALHVGGHSGGDWDLYLKPKEAKALADLILDRLTVLAAPADAADVAEGLR